MNNITVKMVIPFESLVASVAELNLEQERRLWKILDEEIALAEEETWKASAEEEASIREARAAYEAGDYVTIDQYLREF